MSKKDKALELCKKQFEFYATEHRGKVNRTIPIPLLDVPATIAKAEVNEAYAKICEEALLSEPSVDITALQTIQDYRFGSLIKGEHYAFARGLTINPTHLPAALDAMEKDGYTLVSIFGATEADKIGFIFRRDPDSRNAAQLAHENQRLQARIGELFRANNGEVERRREAERKLSDYRSGVPFGEIG